MKKAVDISVGNQTWFTETKITGGENRKGGEPFTVCGPVAE